MKMFGIPFMELHSTRLFCYNEISVKISSKFESIFNKKHISISYNIVRWLVVVGIVTIG